jgi:biopolymer transport protein ExbB
MENQRTSAGGSILRSLFTPIVIVVCLIIGYCVYKFVLGADANFEGNNPANHPKKGNWYGVVYKGGPIVFILMAIVLIIITVTIERLFTIIRAMGRGGLTKFVSKLQYMIKNGQVNEAIAECNRQKGSLANVMRAGLYKFEELDKDTTLDKDQKVLVIQREFEEATSLELPMLSKNMVVISTLASVATLVGLIGTVLGMIKAFAALAQAGNPDAIALANGISEALINTFLGIGGSVVAIIMYNVFNSIIDSLTYKIDEAGFSLIQTFAAKQGH